jgi:hypothetical protein
MRCHAAARCARSAALGPPSSSAASAGSADSAAKACRSCGRSASSSACMTPAAEHELLGRRCIVRLEQPRFTGVSYSSPLTRPIYNSCCVLMTLTIQGHWSVQQRANLRCQGRWLQLQQVPDCWQALVPAAWGHWRQHRSLCMAAETHACWPGSAWLAFEWRQQSHPRSCWVGGSAAPVARPPTCGTPSCPRAVVAPSAPPATPCTQHVAVLDSAV